MATFGVYKVSILYFVSLRARIIPLAEISSRLSSEERSFEVKVERAIQEIDDLGSKDTLDAEAELEECQTECAAVRDHLQKAREGRCPRSPRLSHPLTLGCNLSQGKEFLPKILTQCRFVIKIALSKGLTGVRGLDLLASDLL